MKLKPDTEINLWDIIWSLVLFLGVITLGKAVWIFGLLHSTSEMYLFFRWYVPACVVLIISGVQLGREPTPEGRREDWDRRQGLAMFAALVGILSIVFAGAYWLLRLEDFLPLPTQQTVIAGFVFGCTFLLCAVVYDPK